MARRPSRPADVPAEEPTVPWTPERRLDDLEDRVRRLEARLTQVEQLLFERDTIEE